MKLTASAARSTSNAFPAAADLNDLSIMYGTRAGLKIKKSTPILEVYTSGPIVKRTDPAADLTQDNRGTARLTHLFTC